MMKKRKSILLLLATAGVLVATLAYSTQRAQVFPGRNLLHGAARLVDFEFMNTLMRFYANQTYQLNVDKNYSVAVVENPSKGLVPICSDDFSYCINVESEAAIWVYVNDPATGAVRYKGLNYGIVTSGAVSYTYVFLPPPAVATSGNFNSYVILPLLNADGSPKSWTPWLSEWVFTSF